MQTALAENVLNTEPVTATLAGIQAEESSHHDDDVSSVSVYWAPADLRPYQPDPAVQQLPDVEPEAMKQMIRRLKGADAVLAASLLLVARSTAAQADSRSLAIEIVAAARAALFEPYVMQLILELLDSPDETVRFAATAAASDVSGSRRVAFIRPMRHLASAAEPSPDIRRAAAAFLRALDAGH